ncbi:MAG: 2-amino-4-hydroxy-6-hydroxymethyldihydropteridine diphosphokinase [Desulfobacterales bacterium]|nr:2-amino-4-hydroxy-6-hydroxymethyldihydropteridine diphosphokinase [Desulfobacterales bacterium]
MANWTTAYLSIGSNKGNKAENLLKAINCLEKAENIRLIAVSGFYRTAPQNFKDQDWFVNAALKVETQCGPEALLDLLKAIETDLDKDGKPFRFGPRVIDLDIIYFDTLALKTNRLELPHPRMHERNFVLKPLSDIAKDLAHPVLNKTTDELLQQIKTDEDQAVIPLDQEEPN